MGTLFKSFIITILILNSTTIINTEETMEWTDSAHSIPKELFLYIRERLPEGTILELGSGWASGQLSKFYTLYSIEHDHRWLNRYNTNYIYAPIKNRWYNVDILKRELPEKYDLILIDGPPGDIGRGGFYTNLWLFDTNTIIIFDDVNRKAEYDLMVRVANKLNRGFTVSAKDRFGKMFGIIEPR